MSSLSNYLENKLVDHLLRGQAYTPPATLYYALFTSAPTDAGGGTEVSGGSYARSGVTPSLANFAGTQSAGSTVPSTGTGGSSSNNGQIAFPAPTAGWGNVTHFGVFDASSGGNLLIHGALTAAKTINSGDAAPVFPAGAFSFTLA